MADTFQPDRILEKNSIENTNIDGACFNNFTTGQTDLITKGRLNECELTFTSNTISMNTGEIIATGFRNEFDSAITFAFSSLPASTETYSIILEIDVDENNIPTSNIYLILKSQLVLIQDNIFKNGSGTYMVEIAYFDLTSAGILEAPIKLIKTLGGVIESKLELGETPTTAYAGDKGKANAAAIAELDSKAAKINKTNIFELEQLFNIAPLSIDGYNAQELFGTRLTKYAFDHIYAYGQYTLGLPTMDGDLVVASQLPLLDEDGFVKSENLSPDLTDILEVDNYAALPVLGKAGKIYLTKDTNYIYRYDGTVYIQIAGCGGSSVEIATDEVAGIVKSGGDISVNEATGEVTVNDSTHADNADNSASLNGLTGTTSTTGTGGVFLGESVGNPKKDYAIAIGNSSSAGHYGIVLGKGVWCDEYGIAQGWTAQAYKQGVAIGGASVATVNSIALGYKSYAGKTYSVSLGAYAKAYIENWVSFDGKSGTTSYNRIIALKSLSELFFRNEDVDSTKTSQEDYILGKTMQDYIFNQNTQPITITMSDIVADTNAYFDYDSTSGDLTPKSNIDFSNKVFTLAVAEPTSNININIKPNGTQPVMITILHDAVFITYNYNILVYDYSNNSRQRLIASPNGKTIEFSRDALSTTAAFRVSLNINDCQPFNSTLL